MFSNGTFQRYLSEVENTQEKLAEVYESLVDGIADKSLKQEMAEFLDELRAETQAADQIREALSRQN